MDKPKIKIKVSKESSYETASDEMIKSGAISYPDGEN